MIRSLLTAPILASALLWAPPLAADPLLGLWRTAADHKGQVAHVKVRRCGGGFCGRIVAVLSGAAPQPDHRNLGKDLFWDMRPTAGGSYEGRGWVPLHNVKFRGKARVNGDRLELSGCAMMVCRKQIWRRLR